MNSRHCLCVILLSVLAGGVQAQGNNGRGKCMEPFGISFYEVKAGFEDEWLDLYMTWHYPIMEYALENGTLLEHKLFVPDGHGMEGAWTFAVSFLYPASQNAKAAPLDRAGLISELFGERMDKYLVGEKRRWQITTRHWDTDFIELDKSEKPLSVYLPSPGGCKSD